MKALFILCLIGFVLASGFIASRICRAYKHKSNRFRYSIWATVLLLDISFFLTRILPDGAIWLNRILYIVSTTWLVVVLYAFCTLFTLQVVRTVALGLTNKKIYHTPQMLRISLTLTALAIGYGYFSAINPVVTTYNTHTSALDNGTNIRLSVVSDIHAGYAIGRDDIAKLVTMVNNEQPDVVLLVGDLVDGSMAPVESDDILGGLKDLRAPLGVYAVMGNHEYLDDDARAERYIRSIEGLTLLRDSTATIGPLTIIGRNDKMHKHKHDVERKSLSELTTDTMQTLTIVMDHQPSDIDEASESDITLNVSGHTHAGQVWPFRLFTKQLFRLDYGMGCFGPTTAIVTSGYGTWGPRVRLGSRAEVVTVNISGTRRKAETTTPQIQ